MPPTSCSDAIPGLKRPAPRGAAEKSASARRTAQAPTLLGDLTYVSRLGDPVAYLGAGGAAGCCAGGVG